MDKTAFFSNQNYLLITCSYAIVLLILPIKAFKRKMSSENARINASLEVNNFFRSKFEVRGVKFSGYALFDGEPSIAFHLTPANNVGFATKYFMNA